ncbi:MAG TPA: DUF4962 domain-containing protein [Verrucomicrobiota bacterium]|nr:DUF4962 domain-containing protein [Verrucomicrobiota bacterium]HNU50106.1 DUF4962 domain-containing protein [Verrucomicrobiota bacterium]
MRTLNCLLVTLGLLLPISAATPPVISNREPKAGEWGYHPADGATTLLNPPSLTWIHEASAATYTVQWSATQDFSDATTASNFVWNTYTHHTPLAPGTWHWRYRFLTPKGATSNWSRTRTVAVPAEAIAFPMPSRAQQRERVPAGHPRLFLRPEDLPRLRALAQGREADRFSRLRTEASRLVGASPTPEPVHMGSARNKEDREAVKYWWPNRTQTEKACIEAEILAFVYLITQDPACGEAARQRILHLASWNPDGPTNFRLNCEAAKPMLFRPARAYDWAYERLTPADRSTVQNAMRRRIMDAWESGEVGRGTGHLNRPYNSHGNRVWHKIGEAGIAFLGEIPEAETWLDYALNKFWAAYPVWSDDDGGWHEGVSYWTGYQGKAVWWLQVAHVALNIDGLKKPFFAKVGDYPLYVAPPHSPNIGFGDLSHRPVDNLGASFMEYHIRMKSSQPDGERAACWRWWAEQIGMRSPDGILGFLNAANLPPLPAPKPPTDLPPSKVFRGIGVASLHATLLDSRDDVHCLFKSSPFGTQSHGHNAHNSFQLNAYGDALLPACVYRDLHGSKFHYQWAHSTRAQNAVLVNGQGQIPHTAAPHGRIAQFTLGDLWDHLLGDATDAYGGRLTRAHRQIIFVKPDLIVLCDDLEAREPSTFEFMLHGLKPFTLDPEQSELRLELPRAGLTVRYVSAIPLKFRQWDGFEPPPNREFPNQWHVEAATAEKQNAAAVLTVLAPHRAGQRSPVSTDRIETDTTLGARIRRGSRTVTVTFPKAGAAAPPGVEFE